MHDGMMPHALPPFMPPGLDDFDDDGRADDYLTNRREPSTSSDDFSAHVIKREHIESLNSTEK